jgi:hypothetical protein
VTGAMFEWWMGWHYMEHQRYKLWHPRAHIANGTDGMQGDSPQLSDREKYMTTHLAGVHLGRDMLVHCGMEMHHLAGFLPDLYGDYHKA